MNSGSDSENGEFYCSFKSCDKKHKAFKSRYNVKQHYARFHNLKTNKYPVILDKPQSNKSKKFVDSDSEEDEEQYTKKAKKSDADDNELKKALKDLEVLKAKVNREKAIDDAAKNLAVTKDSLDKEAKLEHFHESLKRDEEGAIIRMRFYESTLEMLIQKVRAIRTLEPDEAAAGVLIAKIIENDGHLANKNLNDKESRDFYIDLLQGLLNHHINPHLQDIETIAIANTEQINDHTKKFVGLFGGFCELQKSLLAHAYSVPFKDVIKDYSFAELYIAVLKHALEFKHEHTRVCEVLKVFLDAKLENAKKVALSAK